MPTSGAAEGESGRAGIVGDREVVGRVDHTVIRGSGGTPTLVVADGRRVVLDRLVMIGRDPVASVAAGACRLLAMPEDLTVSKTHVAIGGDAAAGWWVEDLGSTNGTTIDRGGVTIELPPRRRVPLEIGDRLGVGEQWITVAER